MKVDNVRQTLKENVDDLYKVISDELVAVNILGFDGAKRAN